LLGACAVESDQDPHSGRSLLDHLRGTYELPSRGRRRARLAAVAPRLNMHEGTGRSGKLTAIAGYKWPSPVIGCFNRSSEVLCWPLSTQRVHQMASKQPIERGQRYRDVHPGRFGTLATVRGIAESPVVLGAAGM
jgi:hypothetical protein